MKKTILLTGGAGYVGAHSSYALAEQGYSVIVLDAFLHNQPTILPWADVIHGDCGDGALLSSIFKQKKIDAVMHFAALIDIKDSTQNPHLFYHTNLTKTLTLLECMLHHSIKNFVFSSTCAVYGNPIYTPMDESHPLQPINPYGKTKKMVEEVLADYDKSYGLKSVSLRYFNASGAFPEKGLGEYHNPESHAIPLLLKAAQTKTPFTLYGTQYNTPDGTCIRDFIHVRDIADAHVKALHHLEKTQVSDTFNLGTGHGYSVQTLITTLQNLIGKKIPVLHSEPRPGDAPILIADPTKIMNLLSWKPHFSSLEFILKSALRFEEIRTMRSLLIAPEQFKHHFSS